MKSTWVVLVLLLLALLYAQWELVPVHAPRMAPQRAATAPEPADAAPPELPNLPQDPGNFDVIAQRPLFVEGRQPLEEDEQSGEGEEQAGELKGLDYTAVLILPGKSMAWVRDPAAGKTESLEVGELLRGWRVKAIEADVLRLENGEREATLELREPPKPADRPAGKPVGGSHRVPGVPGVRPRPHPPTPVPSRKFPRPNGSNQ